MAHAHNYNMRQARGVLKEAARELKKYENNVDPARTHLNYNLAGGSSAETLLAI